MTLKQVATSVKVMKYSYPSFPCTCTGPQTSVTTKSPTFLYLVFDSLGSSFAVCLPWMQASQVKFRGESMISIPSTTVANPEVGHLSTILSYLPLHTSE